MTTPPPDTLRSLRIAAITALADGIRGFTLVDPQGAELPAFTAGAHIQVCTPQGHWRKYSLCNAPSERHHYQIAVKRDDTGRGGSLSMHQDLAVGQLLQTAPPDNAFALVEQARSFLFIAGGIGITPILSMVRALEEDGSVPWKLWYLSRSPQTTAFLPELRDAAGQRRLVVHHDGGQPDQAYDLWPALEKPNTGHVYCCGPKPLMESVRDMTGHWSRGNIHFESFNEGGGVQANDHAFDVVLARSGQTLQVPVGQSILSVLRDHGCQVPSSCESGTCGTCRTGLLEGEADHRDMVLYPEEGSRQIMVCVSRAKGARLVLDR
jgi:phthalate 4,5-dioxygenase reductase subunit